jgi:hypothetical protein
MLQWFRERRALKQWQKSVMGEALRDHGHNFFWSDEAPFGYLDESQKLQHCAELHAAAIGIMGSENPIIACRERLAGYVEHFAQLMVIGMREDGKREHELYADSPYISGDLRPHIEEIIPHVDELGRLRFDDPDISLEEIGDYCTTRASLLLFYANGLNMLSIYLEDRALKKSEWYRAYIQAAMVAAEDLIREKTELPSLLPRSTGGLVYGMFTHYVINGEVDPFYTWTRAFPDWYLWRRGEKPTVA